ncbi:MAG: helix-hairpin-helix domain-containing protein [Oscillospiraceae bacterium]|nr:helix-hairpin-helix domain-containing protein [Oscillospiraceae bacterium]
MNKGDKLSEKVLVLMFAGTVVLTLSVVIFNAASSPKFTNRFFVPSYSESEENISFKDYENYEESSVFPIGINTASYEDLQLIPGIGPTAAKLIIDYRNEYGTILDFDELISIDGIGEKTIEILKEYCIIN